MNTISSAAHPMKRFRLPSLIIGRFVFRQSLRGAIILGVVLSTFVCSRALLFHTSYGTPEARAEFAHLLENNVGPRVLFSTPPPIIDTPARYVAWNTLSVVTIIGAIWALLVSTRYFRGEEEAGRSELLLAGQTTAKGAATNTVLGITASIGVISLLLAIPFIHVGAMDTVSIPRSAALFYVLAVVSSLAMFTALGALISQLFATRSRVLGVSLGLFGVFFAARAIADTTSFHWLLTITPLGWILKLQPLYNSQPIWLVPIGVFTLSCSLGAVLLASRRDLHASIIADTDTAPPQTRLLRTPLSIALRLTRATSIGWLTIIGLTALLFGGLTKSAVQAFSANHGAQNLIGRVSGAASTNIGATAFLGVAFLLLMTLGMFYIANALSKIRNDEGEGYLDNLLVRPVSRTRWLFGRILLAVLTLMSASLLAGILAWGSATIANVHLSFNTLLLAGVNASAPALLLLGIGICCFGILPRFTNVVVYGIAAWSFFIAMLGSGSNLNHWLLDSSLLHHISLAPASLPHWSIVMVFVVLGAMLCTLGLYAFNRRDIERDN